MKRIRVISASDTVNRYGSRLAVEALVGALWDNCELGNPLLLNHDFTRPIGWTRAVAIHMEPGLSRLVGQHLIPETENEIDHLAATLNRYLQKKLADECETELEVLRDLASDHLLGRGTPLCGGCVALVETDLAKRALPDLFSEMDRDGLIPVSKLMLVGPGVYRVGEFAVFAHPSFRRSFSRLNTLNAPFLSRIHDLPGDSLDIRIALDPDMLGLASTYRESVELEFWWGPRFDDNLTSIPTGVTRHEADKMELLFHGISRTEFWWQSRDKQHIFEAEELKDIPDTSGERARYGCRYAHSLVEEQTNTVTHLDGAVRTYSEERMIERLEAKISEFGRDTDYTKLWRVDGKIDVATWKGLLSDYFRNNRLVGEYLGAPSIKGVTAPAQRANAETGVREYVPYSIQAGDGVRVSLSFDARLSGVTERMAFSPEVLALEGERASVVEMEAIELKKALAKRRTPLHISSEGLMKYGDGYANLPLVLHGQTSTEEDLYETLDAIETLVRAWHQQEFDLVVSHHVVFPVQGKDALISVYGHVADLANWFSNPLSRPSTTIKELREWAGQVSAFLSQNYRPADDTPSLGETLKDTGILWAERRLLDEDEYLLTYSEERSALEYLVKIAKDKTSVRLLEEEKISPALALLVKDSKCSACGASYVDCQCSKLLDEDVSQRITDVRDAFVFWTDQPLTRR
jgi:hypothetical protein